MNRNYTLDFWRFVFALSILMVHSNGLSVADYYHHPFVGGYIAVEFFFIVTGLFMKQSVSKVRFAYPISAGRTAMVLTYNKMKKMWKITTCATITLFFVSYFLNHPPINDVLRQGCMLMFEIFYLPMAGFQETFYNVPLWYLSAVCILCPVVYWFLLTHDDLYSNIIAPLCCIFIYGWYWTTYRSIENWNVWNGYFLIGLLRGLAGINAGIICYEVGSWIKKQKTSKYISTWLSLIENGGYIAVLILSYYRGYNYLDFVKITIFMTAVSITFSEKGILYQYMNKPFFYHLGQYSFMLYSTHWLSRTLVPRLLPRAGYTMQLPVYIITSLTLALIVYTFICCRQKNKRGRNLE